MINLQYLYLNENDPSSQVIFQDQNSQIVGLKFKKSDLNDLAKNENAMDFSTNNCIYFLLNESEIYIGKSTNGANRIKDHVRAKIFWDYGLMFTTDNASWTSTTIDYLEYHFINKFKKLTTYTLNNSDERNNEPNITMYDKASINSAITKINFYLNCHSISTNDQVDVKVKGSKIYTNKSGTAKVTYQNDKFILLAGSQLTYPSDLTESQYYINLYERATKQINDFIDSEQVDENLVTLKNLEFDKPYRIALLVSGYNQNGWTYFDGINELREN